jgi:hypothetical protein
MTDVENKGNRAFWIEWLHNFCDIMIMLCDGALVACVVVITIIICLWIAGVQL